MLAAVLLSGCQQRQQFPPRIKEILEAALRPSTKKTYTHMCKKWYIFAGAKHFNPYMPTVRNVIDFLDWRVQSFSASATTLLRWKTAIKWVVNSSFHPVIDNILVSRYITGIFHLHPAPPVPPREIWDVNDVLAYWDRQPPNPDLPLILLTQKTILLVLISTMKRRAEVLSMDMRNIIYRPNTMIFPLDAYPKQYSLRSRAHDLRYISVKKVCG